MAPSMSTEQHLKHEAATTFFQSVGLRSYPGATQKKEQPWMQYVSAAQASKQPAEQSDRMVVICSLKHDYGMLALLALLSTRI
jgi:hypothetical protein